MKTLLRQLSIAALALVSSALYAETPPDGQIWFRANNLKGDADAGVSFSAISTWNEYSATNDAANWQAISMDVLPWNLPWAAENQMKLKFDNSTINVDEAIGSVDSLVNLSIEKVWNSTLNIKKDFYITGNITQDGSMTLNIDSGAKVYVNSIGKLASTNIKGAGTRVTLSGDSTVGDAFNVSDGAVLNVINNKTFYVEGANTGAVFDGATMNGRLQVRNGGVATFKNSTLNAGRDNQFIESGNNATLTFDNSVINAWYNGYDTASTTAAKWNGNVMFLGLGGSSQQTFTFKNGTVVNGAGSSTGVSYWDMDPETRTLASITNGGNINMGWNSFSSEEAFFVLNIESGTKYAGMVIEFGNSNGTNSAFGSITINQSGTDATTGLTQVHLGGDVNIRASRYSGGTSTYASTYNLNGYTELLTRSNLNIGSNESKSGSANLNITGSGNTIQVKDIYFNSYGRETVNNVTTYYKSDANLNLIFDKDSSNNTFLATGSFNGYFGSDATHNFVLDGKNNSFKSTGDFNFVNATFKDFVNPDESVLTVSPNANLSVLGEGNVFDVKKFKTSNDQLQDAATAGNISVLFKGSNVENKNKVFVRDAEMLVQGSTVAGSTLSVNYEFAGNTIFRGAAENSGVWLKIHEWGGKLYTTDSIVKVSGSGNDLLLSGLEIGKTTGGGKGIFKIAGGGNRIEINTMNATARNGFRIDNGGELHYAIQNSGTSAIYNFDKNTSKFSGKLHVDFSEMARATIDESGVSGGWEKFVLFATVDATIMSSNGFIGTWFTIDESAEDIFESGYTYLILNEDYVSTITRDASDEYVFIVDESFLDEVTGEYMVALSVMYKSTVPEPSTYALIFGALSLAFVAYRRKARKN